MEPRISSFTGSKTDHANSRQTCDTTCDIANRLLCASTNLPFADIELDCLTDSLDRDRLDDAENQLAGLPLKIIDEGSARLSQILASARAECRRGLRLLILDYLGQLIPDDDPVHREPR